MSKIIAIYLFILAGITFLPNIAFAADFHVLPGDPGIPALVIVTGEFSPGDEAAFIQEVISIRDALVVFSSPGGSLGAGLEIGKAIRLKNFGTYVPAGSFCASACGLAWLGGTRRLMSTKAKIGFHAAYNNTSGFARESGMANAMVGAYLNSLGLPNHAVAYMTMASPDSMAWLTPQDATALGLNVEVFDLDDGDQRSAPATNQNENTPAPSEFAAATELTKRVQQCLSGFKFYRGPINGLMDKETAYSITKFQRAWDMLETGAPTYELLSKCGIRIE